MARDSLCHSIKRDAYERLSFYRCSAHKGSKFQENSLDPYTEQTHVCARECALCAEIWDLPLFQFSESVFSLRIPHYGFICLYYSSLSTTLCLQLEDKLLQKWRITVHSLLCHLLLAPTLVMLSSSRLTDCACTNHVKARSTAQWTAVNSLVA